MNSIEKMSSNPTENMQSSSTLGPDEKSSGVAVESLGTHGSKKRSHEVAKDSTYNNRYSLRDRSKIQASEKKREADLDASYIAVLENQELDRKAGPFLNYCQERAAALTQMKTETLFGFCRQKAFDKECESLLNYCRQRSSDKGGEEFVNFCRDQAASLVGARRSQFSSCPRNASELNSETSDLDTENCFLPDFTIDDFGLLDPPSSALVSETSEVAVESLKDSQRKENA
jgi:hypothetical protein